MFRLLIRGTRPYPLTPEETWQDVYLRARTACLINFVLVVLTYIFARSLGFSGLFGHSMQPGNWIAGSALGYIFITWVFNEFNLRARVLSPQAHLYLLGIWLYLGNVAVISALVHFAGGVNSLFPFLYMVLAVVGSFLIPFWIVIILALIGSSLHGLVLWLEYHEIVPVFPGGLYILSTEIPVGQATLLVWAVATGMTVLALFFGRQLSYVYETQRAQLTEHRANLERLVEKRTAELTKALDELRNTNVSLDREKKRQERFFAHVTHQFRTPIHIINNFVSNFFNGVYGDISPRQGEALHHLSLSSQNLLNLINNLLDMAKIQSGKMVLQLETQSLRDLVEKVTEEMKPLGATRGVKIQLKVDSRVPETIRTDRFKLESILTNLIHNAVKFSKNTPVIVRVMRPVDDGELIFQVADSGTGIAEEHRERIFEAFEQLDSPKDFRGSGLGLFICRTLAEMLDGEVRLLDAPEPGSTFELILPLTAGEKP